MYGDDEENFDQTMYRVEPEPRMCPECGELAEASACWVPLDPLVEVDVRSMALYQCSSGHRHCSYTPLEVVSEQ